MTGKNRAHFFKLSIHGLPIPFLAAALAFSCAKPESRASEGLREGYAKSDVRIHYLVEGSGPWLVMLHGYLGRAQGWIDSGWADALKDSYRLLMIDLRGFGLSDKPSGGAAYTMEKRVSDVLAVMDKEKVKQAHFLGFSMGGKLGFSLMGGSAKDRFLSYSILSSNPYAWDLSEDAQLYRSTYPDTFPFPSPMPRDEKELAYLRSLDKEKLADGLATGNFPDQRIEFLNCKRPIAIFYGSEEPKEDTSGIRNLLDPPKNYRTVEIPGIDHLGFMYKPADAIKAVRSFLETVKGQ
jgi:pimeloyl-ACP methyl ester carboxylesterase